MASRSSVARTSTVAGVVAAGSAEELAGTGTGVGGWVVGAAGVAGQ